MAVLKIPDAEKSWLELLGIQPEEAAPKDVLPYEPRDTRPTDPNDRVVGDFLRNLLMGGETKGESWYNALANLMPVGMVAPGTRSADEIRNLRKLIAGEHRARGPIGKERVSEILPFWHPAGSDPEDYLDVLAKSGIGLIDQHMESGNMTNYLKKYNNLINNIPDIITYNKYDPAERLLRGSWYHGMSGSARQSLKYLFEDLSLPKSRKNVLDLATKYGFPRSLHDQASISNTLGEPAGVSLSAMPWKSEGFSADKKIHRVLPLFEGNPVEKVVNLLTPEGRTLLNDTYDTILNRWLDLDVLKDVLETHHIGGIKAQPEQIAMRLLRGYPGTGQFNKELSEELMSQGKRGVLYNPLRMDEYELLMLDPKYALPLDYRSIGDYSKSLARVGSDFTPGIRDALSELHPDLRNTPQRLREIYGNRSLEERLPNAPGDIMALIEMLREPK